MVVPMFVRAWPAEIDPLIHTRAMTATITCAAPLAARPHPSLGLSQYHSKPMWIILPLLFHILNHHPPVFLNTTPTVFFNTIPTLFTTHNLNYNTFPMDTYRQKQAPQENPLSIPMSIMYHHATMDSLNTSFHFAYQREMEQMKAKQEKFYAARLARIQKQKEKLDECSDLPKCCNRFLPPLPHTHKRLCTVQMQNITEALVCSLFMVFVFAGAVSLRPYLPRIWSKSATSTSTTTPERSEKTSCCNARTRVRGILPMPLLCSQWLHSVGFPVYVLMSWSLYLSVLCVCVSQALWQQY